MSVLMIGLAFAFSSLGLARGSVHEAVIAKASRPLVAASWVHKKDVQARLSEVLHDALGADKEKRFATDISISKFEEKLRPIYSALPKNVHGRVEHAAVRYAVHRYFVHEHAMYIKGLEPAGEAWNSSSPADVLEDQVPTFVQHIFEERMHDGLNLHDLATFAAALEHIIYGESAKRLQDAYHVSGFTVNASINASQLEGVLDAYMAMHLTDLLPPTASRATLAATLHEIGVMIDFWPKVQIFMREIMQDALKEDMLEGQSIPPSVAKKIAKTIQERYGRWQDGDCRSMAQGLIDLEVPGTGRIKLSDFYSAHWRFSESKEYLKSIGALDDSNPSTLRVIIPNYVGSITNCVGTDSMYSTCCIDQCEELLGHLERRVVQPASSVNQLVELVSALPSPTTKAPRQLSSSLIGRLQEIAAIHSGKVPLHGRLFAQWLHHAYPRECPFPQPAGTTKPRTPDEWMKDTGMSPALSNQQVQEAIAESKEWEAMAETKDLEGGSIQETMPWLEAEELVARHVKPTLLHELAVVLRAFMCVAALFSVLATMTSALRSTAADEVKKLTFSV